jgi:hypothetical protein
LHGTPIYCFNPIQGGGAFGVLISSCLVAIKPYTKNKLPRFGYFDSVSSSQFCYTNSFG